MRTRGGRNFTFLHIKVFPFLIRILMQINLWLIIVRMEIKISGSQGLKPGDNSTKPGNEHRPQ
jgi:hypothetical protein